MNPLKIVLMGNYSAYPFAFELGVKQEKVRRVTSWNETLADALASLPNVHVHVISRHKGQHTAMVQKGRLSATYFAVPKLMNAMTLFGFTAWRAHRIIQKIKPDIVHGIGTEHIWPTAALMSGYPAVVTVHGIMNNIVDKVDLPFNSRKRWIYKWFAFLEKRVLRRADHLISISPYVVDSLAKFTNASIHSVENPVSQRFFDVTAHPGSSKQILFVGDTGQRKSLMTLLEAYARLKDAVQADGWQIVIIGPASKEPYHNKVMNFIRERNLDERVFFRGFLFPDDLAEQYGESALLALSSIEETAPMCIAEAMAAGLPVVATNVAGVPYMVDDKKTGFLCAVNNPAEMAEHLRSLMASPRLRDEMGKKAKSTASQRWTPEEIAQQTLSVYRSVLNECKQP